MEQPKSLRIVTTMYMAMKEYNKAEPILRQATDSNTAISYIDLAYCRNKQGDYQEAEQLCLKGLWLQQKQFYPDHPYIAYTLRILSSIYKNQGRYKEAEEVHNEAVRIIKITHSISDPNLVKIFEDSLEND